MWIDQDSDTWLHLEAESLQKLKIFRLSLSLRLKLFLCCFSAFLSGEFYRLPLGNGEMRVKFLVLCPLGLESEFGIILLWELQHWPV